LILDGKDDLNGTKDNGNHKNKGPYSPTPSSVRVNSKMNVKSGKVKFSRPPPIHPLSSPKFHSPPSSSSSPDLQSSRPSTTSTTLGGEKPPLDHSIPISGHGGVPSNIQKRIHTTRTITLKKGFDISIIIDMRFLN